MSNEPMWIQLAAGDCYLTGYINCDIEGEIITDEQKLRMPYRGLENYYNNRVVGHKHPTYVDRKFDLTCLPWDFEDECAEQVIMIQAIEHFDFPTAQRIVSEVLRILKPGGKFLVDFPDLAAGVKQYADEDPDFLIRYIYCNHKNQYSIHHWGYTRETFPRLLGFGWTHQFRDFVRHHYPVIGVEAMKMP